MNIEGKLTAMNDEIQEVQARMHRLKEEHSDQLQKVSKNEKELQSKFACIRQTTEKVVEYFGTIILTIILAIKNNLGISSGSGGGGKPAKDSNKVVT